MKLSPSSGNNNNFWDLSKFSVIKTEEISKNLDFKILLHIFKFIFEVIKLLSNFNMFKTKLY